jgi:hypothetical protein
MNSFTWKSVDLNDLNAGPGAVVPVATVLENARAIGVAQLQLTGFWLADSVIQVDSLTLVSHRDTLPNKPPAFTSMSLTGAAVGDPFAYAILVDDPDSLAVTVTAPTLPAWLTLNESSGDYSLAGTPTAGDIGIHAVELIATNSAGAQAWQCFRICRIRGRSAELHHHAGGDGGDRNALLWRSAGRLGPWRSGPFPFDRQPAGMAQL